MSIDDVVDFIGCEVPAILQKMSISKRQVSVVSGGLPLIIQQVLEKIVQWASQKPKCEV